MKRIFTLMMAAAMVFAGYAQNTPPQAASTQTWTFGNQTWSDAIQIPGCNKETFEKSSTDPQCCSYTHEGKTYYYYNWPYVKQHADLLCPLPWRVPTKDDFVELNDNTNANTLIAAWGYGGGANGSSMNYVSSNALYWPSTENSSNYAYYLYYLSGNVYPQNYTHKYFGFQIRCVK
jgi:hypothetical protein